MSVASIYDVAKLAGVSPSTVSLVLSGRGEQARISVATRQRVNVAAQQLHYRPNISARRLRSASSRSPDYVIALFCVMDIRAMTMGRMLMGLQQAMLEQSREIELMVQPYMSGELAKLHCWDVASAFDGAIIANASVQDLEQMEQRDPQVPIVLFQRQSKRFSTVLSDNEAVGRTSAQLFAAHGRKRAAVVLPQPEAFGSTTRLQYFLDEAKNLGLSIAPQHIVDDEMTMAGGYRAMEALLHSGQAPDAVFFISDLMAAGALPVLDEAGIKVPQQMDILCHGDNEVDSFTKPTLSTTRMPVEEITGKCLELLLELIESKDTEPRSVMLDAPLIIRQSCPGFPAGWP